MAWEIVGTNKNFRKPNDKNAAKLNPKAKAIPKQRMPRSPYDIYREVVRTNLVKWTLVNVLDGPV
jgi:hypothetical protein